jgi:hypothetical protein
MPGMQSSMADGNWRSHRRAAAPGPIRGAAMPSGERIMIPGPIARRTMLEFAGPVNRAGPLARMAGAERPRKMAAHPPRRMQRGIGDADYWTSEGEVPLRLYRKRIGATAPGASAMPIPFFIHGSSNSALSPSTSRYSRRGEYSMMNVFSHSGRLRARAMFRSMFTGDAPPAATVRQSRRRSPAAE